MRWVTTIRPSGGNRQDSTRDTVRQVTRFRRLLPVAAAVVVLAGGCGSGFDAEAAADQFQGAYPNAADAQAACVVDDLIERYGSDGLRTELDRPVKTEAFEEAQLRAMVLCGMLGDLTAELEAQLIDGGIPAEAAPCMAEELIGDIDEANLDVLLTGEITEQFYLDYLAAADACSVLNP